MKLSTLRLLPLAALAAAAICSCNSEKPYTISGVLNIPTEMPFGDTVIQIPSPEGEWVYLVEDEDVIDSCQIVDNRFVFTGSVKPSDAYFAQVGCMFFSSLVAVEPGEIKVYTDGMQTTITGTPSNDGINGMMQVLTSLSDEVDVQLNAIADSLGEIGVELAPEHVMDLQEMFDTRSSVILDSVYQANKDNLAGIYAVAIRYGGNSTADEFEEALEDYPKRVRENSFIQELLGALRQREQMMSGDAYDFDPSLFGDSIEDEEE